MAANEPYDQLVREILSADGLDLHPGGLRVTTARPDVKIRITYRWSAGGLGDFRAGGAAVVAGFTSLTTTSSHWTVPAGQ